MKIIIVCKYNLFHLITYHDFLHYNNIFVLKLMILNFFSPFHFLSDVFKYKYLKLIFSKKKKIRKIDIWQEFARACHFP